MIEAISPAMHASRLFGVASKDQPAAIMLKGYVLGLSVTAAFEFIQVVQGKPTLSPRGALALLHQSGQLAGMKITEEDGKCTVWMKRTSGFEYETTFTLEDAKKAGLVKDGGAWIMYQANMLRWRAVGFCADVVFPDVLGGMKRADEFGAMVNESGDVVEGQWTVQETPSTVVEQQIVVPAVTLQELVEKYGAEAVMVACEGKIPATNEEVFTAAEKLEQNNAA
jgi:hypothetical protein